MDLSNHIIPFFPMSIHMKDQERSQGQVLSQGTTRTTTTSSISTTPRKLSREEEIRQVRLRQQEIANQRAKEAEKQRKEKEAQERERRNPIAQSKPFEGGSGGKPDLAKKKPTTSSSNSGSGHGGGEYNPMQPWTASSSGYR
jgi:hypothetical protein